MTSEPACVELEPAFPNAGAPHPLECELDLELEGRMPVAVALPLSASPLRPLPLVPLLPLSRFSFRRFASSALSTPCNVRYNTVDKESDMNVVLEYSYRTVGTVHVTSHQST